MLTSLPDIAPLYRSTEGQKAVMALYDAALSAWPPHETRVVPTRHGDTFAVVCGPDAAPPLVLLHGAGSNSAMWTGDLPALSREFRVYAVDLIGEAGRSAPSRPPWEGPAYADWLADVLDGLALARPALVGLSQGAWTALKFATREPERVSRLVLLCPGGIVRDRLSFLAHALYAMARGEKGVAHLARLLNGRQPVPDGVMEVTRLTTLHFKSRIGALPVFTDDELKRLTMPVLMMGGTHDALRDEERIAARLRALLPRVQVALVPDAGHVLLNTAPTIMAFLRESATAE